MIGKKKNSTMLYNTRVHNQTQIKDSHHAQTTTNSLLGTQTNSRRQSKRGPSQSSTLKVTSKYKEHGTNDNESQPAKTTANDYN